jgi:hypothetical protein
MLRMSASRQASWQRDRLNLAALRRLLRVPGRRLLFDPVGASRTSAMRQGFDGCLGPLLAGCCRSPRPPRRAHFGGTLCLCSGRALALTDQRILTRRFVNVVAPRDWTTYCSPCPAMSERERVMAPSIDPSTRRGFTKPRISHRPVGRPRKRPRKS